LLLRKDLREIRLVILLQGTFHDPINCQFIRERIGGEVVYDALSYRWGDQNDRSPISVNGFPFQATKGLVTALQLLRLESEDLSLWIDALCINQDNVRERNEQVPLMYDIYSRARLVRACVGAEIEPEDSQDADHVFLPQVEAAQRNIYSMSGDGWTIRKLVETFGSTGVTQSQTKIGRSLIDSPSLHAWRKLARLFRRGYWRRVWIQQEIICAPEVVAHYGHDQLPLSLIDGTLATLHAFCSRYATDLSQ
jgi:hypothetical protein